MTLELWFGPKAELRSGGSDCPPAAPDGWLQNKVAVIARLFVATKAPGYWDGWDTKSRWQVLGEVDVRN